MLAEKTLAAGYIEKSGSFVAVEAPDDLELIAKLWGVDMKSVVLFDAEGADLVQLGGIHRLKC